MPIGTLKKWAQEPWWENIITRVTKDKNDELDAALTQIIHGCQEQIQDRLVKGDPRVNYKTGEVYIVPLDMRTLTMSLAILYDKRALGRGEATSRTESISQDDRMKKLKQDFERFSKAQEVEGELINGEVSVGDSTPVCETGSQGSTPDVTP